MLRWQRMQQGLKGHNRHPSHENQCQTRWRYMRDRTKNSQELARLVEHSIFGVHMQMFCIPIFFILIAYHRKRLERHYNQVWHVSSV